VNKQPRPKERPGFTPNPDEPVSVRTPIPDPSQLYEPIPIRFPIEWWRCFRFAPVSGRYEGERTAPTAGRSVLDLRVDIDPRFGISPVLDRISGDFYNVFRFSWPGFPTFTWRVYRESWIVDAPAVAWSRCQVEITGTVRYWKGTHPATTVHVRIPWGTFTSAGPAEVTFTEAGGTSFSYSCPKKSDCFRSVNLEVDVAQSVNTAPLLPNYDTFAHATRPGGLTQRVLNIETAFREAGICVTLDPAHTVIDDSAPEFVSWSDSELHDAMETHFSLYSTSARWNLWGVMVGRHDNSGLAGIMFDYGTAYGGPGRSPERQGFAVFRGHRVFNNLPAGIPASQAEAETLRYFLYVWVHEAGHAFNFLHSWNKGRPNARSWMNYPQYVTNFWNNFEFRFDNEELIHLRHGNRSEVIFGGDPWATGSHLEVPPGAMAQVEGAAPIELLLRSQEFFEFMEPVMIEFRLRNLTGDFPIGVDTRLSPEFGRTTCYIQRPNGQIIEYTPIIYKEGTPEIQLLAPIGKGVEGADRYSENVNLTFDQHGFLFDASGVYLIRAAYQGSDEMLIFSNLHRIRVGNPVSREGERLAQDFFTHEVGMSLYLGGSQSPFLKKGMERLEEMAERYSDSLVGAKAASVVANSVAQPFFRIDDPENPALTQTHEPDPERALALTQPALEIFEGTNEPAHNLAYHQLVRSRADYLVMQGKEDEAKEELNDLRKELEGRGVNEAVLNHIKEYAEDL
jgi:hypothetical protein